MCVASSTRMRRHAFAIWALFFMMLFGFGISVALGSLWMALLCLVLGIVMAFVMGIAWVRFRGYPPEHHPPIDKIVDDTNP